MPRRLRCVLPGAVHHVTQRGVNRCDVFLCQRDREVYLHLIKDNLADAGVKVLGYCLMTNHVHWVVRPAHEESLSILFRRAHGRYAQYLNARLRRTGHLWQNRFFSCFVDEAREDAVLRYAEENPVRAGIADSPDAYPWSSAKHHCTGPGLERVPLIDWDYWEKRGGAETWRQCVLKPQDAREVLRVRRSTYAGSPLGSEAFVEQMEVTFNRKWRKTGRPPKKDMQMERGPECSASVSAG